eukprot:5552951-Amphidinium_carterae.1
MGKMGRKMGKKWGKTGPKTHFSPIFLIFSSAHKPASHLIRITLLSGHSAVLFAPPTETARSTDERAALKLGMRSHNPQVVCNSQDWQGCVFRSDRPFG